MEQSRLFLEILIAVAVSSQFSFDSVVATADQQRLFFFLLLLFCFFGSRRLRTLLS